MDISTQAVMDRAAEKQEKYAKEQRQKLHTEAMLQARTRMMRKNEAMMKKPVKSTRASTSRIIDLDKTVNSIEELLSQKYGSDPFDSSIDYNKSDSDFKP